MTAPTRPELATHWHCDPQGIVCQHDHLLAFYEAGYRADLRDMIGHAFLQCRKCDPPTQFLAVFCRDPSPLVLCYALSKDSFVEWDKRPGRTPPTGELLYRLRDPQGRSHNSGWRPAR
ncbi:MAG: hypothetical protein JWM41_2889 [Gemmatimonadetes bacterium]|nr:hypothetical protein [Gemmatimonadota bacterium]